LESTYEQRLKVIDNLKADIFSLADNLDDLRWLGRQAQQIESSTVVAASAETQPEPSDGWSKARKYAFAAFVFLSGATTGIMIGRIATVVATVAFIPFAAAMLSNPFTIGVLAFCGLVYGGVKLAQYLMDKQEAKAKKLHEERAQKKTLLQGQNEVAGLQIQLLKAKKNELINKKAAGKDKAASLPQVRVVHAKTLDDSGLRKPAALSPVASKQSLFACKEDHMRVEGRSAAFHYALRAASPIAAR
jgi:hypothetical protein